jgi:hypothetical protein
VTRRQRDAVRANRRVKCWMRLCSCPGFFLLAALVEALIEYPVAPWLKPEGAVLPPLAELVRTMALRYSAAAAGLVLCIGYEVDMLALAGLESGWPLVGGGDNHAG